MAADTSSLEAVFAECRDTEGSLNERLAIFAAAVRSQMPSFALAVDKLVARLRETGAGAAAPMVGDAMPAFVLPDETNRMVSLEALLQHGPVAVTFHRGHWCPYCRISIRALARASATMIAEGGQIVAVVPERQRYASELKADGDVPFPILTDLDNGYAMSLNLAIWVGDEVKRMMREQLDRDLATFQGNDSWMLPIPATFVVGRDGKVKSRFVDPDYRKRMAVDELLTALRREL
jgi:peroxiredoxin